MNKTKHIIGIHGAVGVLVRKGKRITTVCTECSKEINTNVGSIKLK